MDSEHQTGAWHTSWGPQNMVRTGFCLEKVEAENQCGQSFKSMVVEGWGQEASEQTELVRAQLCKTCPELMRAIHSLYLFHSGWIFIYLPMEILMFDYRVLPQAYWGCYITHPWMHHFTFLKFEEVWFLQYIWPQGFWKKIGVSIKAPASQGYCRSTGENRYQVPSVDTGKH